MRFKGLDLNLLVALDALLIERNVSAAGRRVFLSQPAMSAALARLRLHFEDELLVPIGRRMALTDFANSIAEPIHDLMLQIEATVGLGSRFDPETSQRTFTVALSDFVTEVIMTRVVAKVAELAPGVVLEIIPPRGGMAGEAIEDGETDLLIMAAPYVSSEHPAELLYQEEHVVVGWRGNNRLSNPLSADTFFDLGHVVVRFGRNRQPTFAEAQIHRGERSRRVELVAPSFTAIPKLLVGTNRIAVMHRRLGEASAEMLPLVVLPLPFALPRLDVMIQHHTAKTGDGGIQWLKQIIHDCST